MQSRSSVLSRSLLASLVLLTTACGDATSGGGDDDVSVTADTAVGADAVTAWSSGVVASPSTVEASVGALASASKVAVSWEAPDESVDHFVVTATTDGAPDERVTAADGEASVTVSRLRSDSVYTIGLTACMDAECADALDGGQVSVTTAQETWQIHGTGGDYAGATHIVADGNTKASTIVYGDGAPAGFDGLFQLYYDPSTPGAKGIQIATLTGASPDDVDSVSVFTTVEGVGLGRKDDPEHQENNGPLTFQVVPLSEALGGGVRLFFEGTVVGDDSAQLHSVDSVDGYEGRDFHTGAETFCPYDEIHPTGACPTTVVFGTAEGANPAFREVRQTKIVLPRLDDWRWDGAVGTPMVVTLHHSQSHEHCSDTMFNAAYLVHDGSSWETVMGDEDCPKSWPGVQAPLPVHTGGPRYKLYFNNNLAEAGGGPLITGAKPIKVMYGDARHTGDEATLDFDDWDGSLVARDVRFLWPDGSELTDEDQSKLDDYEVVAPTSDPDFLVMYSNMSCPGGGCGPPFIGMAVLLNP